MCPVDEADEYVITSINIFTEQAGGNLNVQAIVDLKTTVQVASRHSHVQWTTKLQLLSAYMQRPYKFPLDLLQKYQHLSWTIVTTFRSSIAMNQPPPRCTTSFNGRSMFLHLSYTANFALEWIHEISDLENPIKTIEALGGSNKVRFLSNCNLRFI